LLCPWIRRFTMIISAWWLSAWWLRTSSKIRWQEVKETTGKLGNGQLLSGCGFVQNIAPPLLSRDRRIKMEQNKSISKNRWIPYVISYWNVEYDG